jgi:LPS export ABC transporter protein LptC
LCLLCGVVLLRGRRTPVVDFGTGSEELLKLPTSSTISLSDFHRSESKDGKLVWDVKAVRGEYYPESGRANLKTPAIQLFSEEGSSVTIGAPVGLVLLENEALREARVSGGARVVHQSGVVVESPELTYGAGTQEISTDKTATITGDGVVATSDVLNFHTGTQRLKLSNHVRTTFAGGRRNNSTSK